jgi:hypothetical protein
MKWPIALILVGLLVAGCQSPAPVADPFLGRSATIPPPPTGSATGQPIDQTYPPPLAQPPLQSPSMAAPPSIQMPSQPTSQSAPLSPASTTNAWPPAQPLPSRSTPAMGAAPNYGAPRPPSTGPSNSAAPRTSTPTPSSGTATPYSPPNGSFDFRGTSTQGPLPSFNNVSATRTNTYGDDRTPRPVDDTAAVGGIAGRQTISRTLEPRRRDSVSSRPVDITDLPTTPASGP